MILFLLGMPGSGKSSIGKKLAQTLNHPFLDIDEIIENDMGKSISQVFADEGEDYFRKLEHTVLREIKVDEAIVATGGGTPVYFDNLDYMNETGATVFIDVPLAELEQRLRHNTHRPLLAKNTTEVLYDLYKERLPIYQQAHKSFRGSDEEIISSILQWVRS